MFVAFQVLYPGTKQTVPRECLFTDIPQNEGPSEYILDKYVCSPAFPYQTPPLSHLRLNLPYPFFSPSSSGGGANRSKKPRLTLHGTKKTRNLSALWKSPA